jgi:CRISPR-associated protein Csd1
MILQALKDYYERKVADPDGGIAPDGFEQKEIPFVIVIDADGKLVQIEDTRRQVGKQLRAKSFLVPQSEIRSSGIKAYFLWDNAEYVLGVCAKKDSKPERVADQHKAFVQRIKETNLQEDAGIAAILKFFQSNYLAGLELSEHMTIIKESNPFMTFRLNSDIQLICERAMVVASILGTTKEDGEQGVCLISGEKSNLTRLQPPIKGVRGTNTTGGSIVSFNLTAFNSYGKTQGWNAPIGNNSAFAYTTALNYLLGRDSKQKIQVGDATTVFWSDKKTQLESDFSLLFDEPPKDDPDRLVESVKALYRAVDMGVMPVDDGTRFFVLGLSPNAARISIRFWQTGTIGEFSQKIVQHFHDLDLVHAPHERDHLSIWWLLSRIAALGKSENIPSNLAGDWMRCILAGLPYPDSLYQAALRRIQIEREVSYPRAAIIKACLNRKTRSQFQPQLQHSTEKEMTVALDKENSNVGYRLGRLFATLEKIQEEAQPNINTTIRDRYYASASGTPASVMPILMRLKNHHLGKLEKGRSIYFERQLAEVLGAIGDFPVQLNLQDQGRFAIGYYHQRQAFFTKTDVSTSPQGE